MADYLEDDVTNEESAAPDSAKKPAKGKSGKKRKKRGCGFFILLILLAAGGAAGLQASGGADLRPWVYTIVPRMPLVGPSLKELLGIPDLYSLSLVERRRLELEEWELEIAKRVRSLDADMERMRRVSADLDLRTGEIEESARELASRLEALSDDESPLGQQQDSEELERIVRTFEEMSPKNAAAILEEMNENLAVGVLEKLSQENRAKVLGRMNPSFAALMTEKLAERKK